MKINTIELIISAVRESQYPSDKLKEFLLVGRSNVGKSSFINTIINRKNFARTSATPGKTQTLNFYKINDDSMYKLQCFSLRTFPLQSHRNQEKDMV